MKSWLLCKTKYTHSWVLYSFDVFSNMKKTVRENVVSSILEAIIDIFRTFYVKVHFKHSVIMKAVILRQD